jgi:hypothetical protein
MPGIADFEGDILSRFRQREPVEIELPVGCRLPATQPL